MALNTHALRFVRDRKHRATVEGNVQLWDDETHAYLTVPTKKAVSLRGLDKFTFEAHVKVGAGALTVADRAYTELRGNGGIRFACAPTRNNGRSVLNFEVARTDSVPPVLYSYVIPNGWDNRWHHVAFSLDFGTAKYAIYFDGNKVRGGPVVNGGVDNQNRPLTFSGSVPQNIHFGACPVGDGLRYWDGKMDNVRLWSTFVDAESYTSEDRPVDDHSPKVGALAQGANLIEEWRFNEGPFSLNPFSGDGSPRGVWIFGAVDHQDDPVLRPLDQYEKDDAPPPEEGEGDTGGGQEEDPPTRQYLPQQIAHARLYEGASNVNGRRMWIGVDVTDSVTGANGIPELPPDFDRPFLGEGLTDTTPPSMPRELRTQADAITEDSFKVSWAPSTDNVFVQGYRLEVSTTDSFDSTIYSRDLPGNRTSEEITGLRPASRYYWRVRAQDSAASPNTSQWSSSTAYRRYSMNGDARVNYCPNPSFEGTRSLFGWYPYAENGPLAELAVTTYSAAALNAPDSNNTALYGEHFLSVQRSAGTTGLNVGTYVELPWTRGRAFTCSFWARGTGKLACFLQTLDETRVLRTSANRTFLGTATETVILGNGWTRYGFTSDPGDVGMNRLRIYFVCPNTYEEFELDMDGVLIEAHEGYAGRSFFDGSHIPAAATGEAYWVVPDSSSGYAGYIVGGTDMEGDSSLQFTDESPSVLGLEDDNVHPAQALQTKDYADRQPPSAPLLTGLTWTAASDVGYLSFVAKWKQPAEFFEDIVAYDLQVGLQADLSARANMYVPGYEALRLFNPYLANGVYSYTVTGLRPVTSYYYRVRAVDANGNLSDWSAIKAIATEARPDTTAPTEPVLEDPDDVTFDSFVARWQESTDDTGVARYLLTVAQDDDFTTVVDGYNNRDVGNVLQYTVTGLDEDTTYFYRVRAQDAAGNTSAFDANSEPIEVQTAQRVDDDNGVLTQQFAITSVVQLDSTSPTAAPGVETTLTPVGATKELYFQFTTYRTVQAGPVLSALLHLTRSNPATYGKMTFTITPLAAGNDPLAFYFTDGTVTYNTKPTASAVVSPLVIEVTQPPVSGVAQDVVTLDLTPLLQRGNVMYGFKMTVTTEQAGATPLTFFGGAATDEGLRPELMVQIDTSANLQISRVRTTSVSRVVRNLFTNPTFDATPISYTFGNGSFGLFNTNRWVALDPPSGMSVAFTRDIQSYDAEGGCGRLEITANSLGTGTGSVKIIHRRRIPAVQGKLYTARLAVSTSSPYLKPRVAIFRYDADGQLLGQKAENAEWTPEIGEWYRREVEYTVNDPAVAFISVGLISDIQLGGVLGTMLLDAVELISNEADVPIGASKINASVLSRQSAINGGFDNGVSIDTSYLKMNTNAVGEGVRLSSNLPYDEEWMFSSYEDATINYFLNPSFEHETWSDLVTESGTAGEVSREVVGGTSGTYGLSVLSTASNKAVTLTATLPTWSTTAASQFVGSFYVRGAYSFTAQLAVVHTDDSVVTGSARTFTGTTSWQRITCGSGVASNTIGASSTGGKTPKAVRLIISLTETGTVSRQWEIDGVQIEQVAASSGQPTPYCDGDREGCYWYALPHRSLSFRNAYVASVRVMMKQDSPALRNLLRLTFSDGTSVTSATTTLSALPSDANDQWFLFRSYPVVPFGAQPYDETGAVYPTELEFDITATSSASREYYLDAVLMTLNDPATTYFNGSTLGADWSGNSFDSYSEFFGSEIQGRVFTKGSRFDRGGVQAQFRPVAMVSELGFNIDEDMRLIYERDARYVDVRVPDRLRWNELSNPEFDVNIAGWKSTGGSVSRSASTDTRLGAWVAKWKLGTSTYQSAKLFTTDLVQAYPGQLWTFQAQATPLVTTRPPAVGLAAGLLFYDSDGNQIAGTYTLPYEISFGIAPLLVGNSVIAPANTAWVRGVVTNHEFSNGWGLRGDEEVLVGQAMLYRGPFGRSFLTGNDDFNVYWEGLPNASPSIFRLQGQRTYVMRYRAVDATGVALIGGEYDQTVQTVADPSDYIEFLFDDAVPILGNDFIELLIPYRGTLTDQATLYGQFRRADGFRRHPLLVRPDPTRNLMFVRADVLSQNKAYVFEIQASANRQGKVRGETQYTRQFVTVSQELEGNNVQGDGHISFNAFLLNGPDSVYYWVSEHDSFSFPQRRTQFELIPRTDGGVELEAYWGTKKISMSGGVWGNTRSQLYDNLNVLRAALSTPKCRLRIDTLANREDYYLATCTDFKVTESAGDTIRSLEWKATFECADPFLYRGQATQTQFTVLSSIPEVPVDFIYTDNQVFTVNNGGTVYALPTITVTAQKGSGDYSLTFHNDTTGEHIMPRVILSKGESITIKTDEMTCYKNGTVPTDYVGSFPRLAAGVNQVRLSIRDLKKSRHNLLINPGAENGDVNFGNDVGIYVSRRITGEGTTGSPYTPVAVTGVTLTKTRYQVADNSNFAALVTCDGLKDGQGVIFRTAQNLSAKRNWANRQRAFSATAFVRTDITNRQVNLNNYYIRIWYEDGTYQEKVQAGGRAIVTPVVRATGRWTLLKIPTIRAKGKAIDYVEVVIGFGAKVGGSGLSFLVDNVILVQDDLVEDDVTAKFDMDISFTERFI